MVVEVLPILATIQPNVLCCLSEEGFHVDEQDIILASHSATSNYYTLPTSYSANVCMNSESPMQVDVSYFHSVRAVLNVGWMTYWIDNKLCSMMKERLSLILLLYHTYIQWFSRFTLRRGYSELSQPQFGSKSVDRSAEQSQ